MKLETKQMGVNHIYNLDMSYVRVTESKNIIATCHIGFILLYHNYFKQSSSTFFLKVITDQNGGCTQVAVQSIFQITVLKHI